MARDPFTSARLKELRAAAKALPAAEAEAKAANDRVAELTRTIVDAVRELAPLMDAEQVAKAAKLTPHEVRDIAGQQAPTREASGLAPSLGERTLAEAGDIETIAGASARPPDGRRYAHRRTLFVHLGRGQVWDATDRKGWTVAAPMGLAELLHAAWMSQARRVFLCDGPDWCVEPGDTRTAAVIRWLGQTVPGWRTPEGKGHYVSDPETPTGYFEHAESGAVVEVHRAGSWFGPAGEYNPRHAGIAWSMLDHLIGDAFKGGTILSTPATTGRALWRMTIPRGREWPVLSEDLRRFIKSTSGQGRTELLAPVAAGAELAEVRQYDGRLMYGALVASMPAGPPTFYRDGAEVPDGVLMGAGRWRITATVPRDWSHVGLLPAPREGTRSAWRYPAEPGETFTTWACGREVALARQRGWAVAIHEGFSFPGAKVLDQWADRLKGMSATLGQWAAAGEHAEACALAERAVRFMILHGIGAFASMAHPILRTAPADRPELANDARPIDGIAREGDLLVWHERAPIDPWAEQTSHPEYSAEIWGRARVRLLQGPKDCPEMGALALARQHVIAFDTDALYVAVDPGWTDDGKPGRLRLKATAAGPMPYPQTLADLRELVK